MESILADIRNRLKTSRFANEASVSQGIVLPILRELGWDVFNVDIVSPEYALEGRRVDFALCHPAKRPQVFFEIKQVGQSVNTERQLFEYAFHLGIPMAVLTDGREWGFFLPGEQGSYDERRVYKLDILERDVDEIVERLHRYLAYDRVRSGDAIEAARQDYRNAAKAREASQTLPSAWAKLVEEQDELLIELVATKVESLCGFRPDVDTVISFLNRNLQLVAIEQNSRVPEAKSKKPLQRQTDNTVEPKSQILAEAGFIYRGKKYPMDDSPAKDILVTVLRKLSGDDKTFLDRFDALPKHGRTRRYVAKTREALYPDSPHLMGSSVELQRGWWVGTNYSKQEIMRILELACEVAEIKFGQDLIINLD